MDRQSKIAEVHRKLDLATDKLICDMKADMLAMLNGESDEAFSKRFEEEIKASEEDPTQSWHHDLMDLLLHDRESSLQCHINTLQHQLATLEKEKEEQMKEGESLRLQMATLVREKEEQLKQVALLEQQKEGMEEQLREKDSLRQQLQEQMKAVDSLRLQVATWLKREKEKDSLQLQLQEQVKTCESLRIQVAMLEREKEEARKLGKEDYHFQKFI